MNPNHQLPSNFLILVCDGVAEGTVDPANVCSEVPLYQSFCPLPSASPSASAAPSATASATPVPTPAPSQSATPVCASFCSANPALNQCSVSTSCAETPSVLGPDAFACACRPGYRPADGTGIQAWRFGDDMWGVAGQSHRVYAQMGQPCEQRTFPPLLFEFFSL
jgi:hypothetical protein